MPHWYVESYAYVRLACMALNQVDKNVISYQGLDFQAHNAHILLIRFLSRDLYFNFPPLRYHN